MTQPMNAAFVYIGNRQILRTHKRYLLQEFAVEPWKRRGEAMVRVGM